jgi:crotonobetainyl-CoA:carnitine CoA-transferase CaiB-like acyl-CoA transferase
MLALEDIRVLDLTHLVPGALCTMILADLGADVIKVGTAAGASSRGSGVMAKLTADEEKRVAAFDALNRNKRSIGLDLKSDQGREIFYKLTRTADVVVEGFRPGVVKRLGVDYAKIKTVNARTVYCSLSGYGQDGPYSNFSGHDINYISIAGALNIIGASDRPPAVPLNLLADFAGASLHGVIGILTALLARVKTGKGQYVDVAYTDGAMSLMTWLISSYFAGGCIFNRGETWLHGAYPYYSVYETKDGKYVSIGCVEPWFWENLCRALGKEEYISYCISPEHFFQKPEGDKWEEISSCLKKVFLTRTRDEWFDFLTGRDVPVGKVYSFDEVFKDPQVLHRNMVLEIDHPTLGKVKHPGIAVKLSDTPGKIRKLAPVTGENTEEILSELGYKKSQIRKLHQSNVIS